MEEPLVIGVLALQGAVEEHMNCITAVGCVAKEIHYPEEIEGVDGIILPGGESTTMAIIGEKRGLFPVLKTWVEAKRPIWGTCAGMILLSDHAIKQAVGGQALIGGLDARVCRNYFGSQLYSREMNIQIDSSIFADSSDEAATEPFKAVFIRAPAILQTGPEVEVLATLKAQPHASALAEVSRELEVVDGEFEVKVAVKQHNILATAFHPELTNDLRWHSAFVQMVRIHKQQQQLSSQV